MIRTIAIFVLVAGSSLTAGAADEGVVPATQPSTAPATSPAIVRYVNSVNAGQAIVTGTSSLHDWTVKSGFVSGHVAISGDWTSDNTSPPALESIELSIPVISLKSTEGAKMDNVMYDAMNRKFPSITFAMSNAVLRVRSTGEDRTCRFDATGNLTIAGKSVPTQLDLVVSPKGDELMISTDVDLKMTDFGIRPPTAMAGLIKAGDQTHVNVTWKLTREQATPK